MPPVTLTAHVAAVAGHGLQIKAGTQALGGDRIGDNAAITVIKDAAPGHISRFVPEAAEAFEVAEKVVQRYLLIPCK